MIDVGDGADDIWLPSATEMFGDDASANATGCDHEDVHFDLYKTEKSRVKECGNNGTWPYWLRSPLASSSTIFCIVSSYGNAYYYNATDSYGIAFGFLINP